MSLVGTLAKVAVGMAVAKGVSTLAKGASGSSAGGLGEMMGGLLAGTGSRTTRSSSTGGLGSLLENLAGAGSRNIATRSSPRGQTTGGLGDILGQLAGGAGGKGGLGDLIGALGAGGAAGGLGSLLGAALGGSGTASGGFGSRLNAAFANGGEPDTPPDAPEEAMAGLMLKAMIQAAKADGEIDAAEQAKLLERLGDVSAAERAFVERELAAPVDVAGLVRAIPDGLEAQAYAMSLMAIDLDNQTEAQYLHQLAEGLGLDAQSVNHIHDQIGAPALYA